MPTPPSTSPVLSTRDINVSPMKSSPTKTFTSEESSGEEHIFLASPTKQTGKATTGGKEKQTAGVKEKQNASGEEKPESMESARGEEEPKSMEYHRQVLQSRLEAEKSQPQTYISPSDNIMSPCTAKLSAYKSKHFMKAKPQSLFGKLGASKSSKPTDDPSRDETI